MEDPTLIEAYRHNLYLTLLSVVPRGDAAALAALHAELEGRADALRAEGEARDHFPVAAEPDPAVVVAVAGAMDAARDAGLSLLETCKASRWVLNERLDGVDA